jgi:hypothetical protein
VLQSVHVGHTSLADHTHLMGRDLGRRAKEHARRHFLSPRYLRDYLRTFSTMVDAA